MKIKSLYYFLLPVILVTAAISCNKQSAMVTPHELSASDSCSLDGMSLLDFPGPKAQVHYANGEIDLFCDTFEMFSIYLQPEQQKRITGIFTQDMGKTSWEEPRGNWIDAKQAFYVLGSQRHGSMGPTIASFTLQKDAEIFIGKYGGQMQRFDQITLDNVDLSGGVIRDEQM